MKGFGHCCGFSFSDGAEHGYGHHEVTIFSRMLQETDRSSERRSCAQRGGASNFGTSGTPPKVNIYALLISCMMNVKVFSKMMILIPFNDINTMKMKCAQPCQ